MAFSSFLFSSTLSLLPLTSNPFISSMASWADLGLSKLTNPMPLDLPFFSVMTLVEQILPNLRKRLQSSESFMLLGRWKRKRLEPAGPSFLLEECMSLSELTSCWMQQPSAELVLKTLAPGGGGSNWDCLVLQLQQQCCPSWQISWQTLSMEQAKGSRSSFSCFLDMYELYFFSLKRTSMGMRLPCRKVCPFRYLIASSALSLFLQSTNAQNCVSSSRIDSISPSSENTSYSVYRLACRGNDPTNNLWSSCCPRPSRCSSVSSHLMFTGRVAPGMIVFFSFSIAYSALVRDANLTREEPVKPQFLRISFTSRIFPNSSKNFQMSSSFQLVGRLPTYTISSIRLAESYSLLAMGDYDRRRPFPFSRRSSFPPAPSFTAPSFPPASLSLPPAPSLPASFTYLPSFSDASIYIITHYYQRTIQARKRQGSPQAFK